MAKSFDYRKAFEQVKTELRELIADRERLDRKIMHTRQTLEALSASCESEGIVVDPSAEAVFLLESRTLSDEVFEILRNKYPHWQRAAMIKNTLEQLGHDMSTYTNPLATIHMILKRHVEADKVESEINAEGERVYRYRKTMGERKERALQILKEERGKRDAKVDPANPPRHTKGKRYRPALAQDKE